MNEKQHIQQLLDLFIGGESTLAQEQELAQYFATHEVDKEWKPVKAMFAYFDEGMPKLDAVPQQPATKKKPVIAVWTRWVAAAVIAAMGITMGFRYSNTPTAQQPAPMPAIAEVSTASLQANESHATTIASTTQPTMQDEVALHNNTNPAQPLQEHTTSQPTTIKHIKDKVKTLQQAYAITQAEVELEMAMMQDAAIEKEIERQLELDKMQFALQQLQCTPMSKMEGEIKEK